MCLSFHVCAAMCMFSGLNFLNASFFLFLFHNDIMLRCSKLYFRVNKYKFLGKLLAHSLLFLPPACEGTNINFVLPFHIVANLSFLKPSGWCFSVLLEF
jgi:hypothetical protein